MANGSPLADQAALDTVQQLLANIDASENAELADKLLQLVFSNNTVSQTWSESWSDKEDTQSAGPEWYQKQKAEAQAPPRMDLVPLVPEEEPPLPPIATEPDEVIATPRQSAALDRKITTEKQRRLEREIESRTFQASDPKARLDESVGEEAYLAKKQLEKENAWTVPPSKEPSRTVEPSRPSMTVAPSKPTKAMQAKMDRLQAEAAQERLESLRDASLDLKLQENAVKADILTEQLNQSRLKVQQLREEYSQSIMGLSALETRKYGL